MTFSFVPSVVFITIDWKFSNGKTIQICPKNISIRSVNKTQRIGTVWNASQYYKHGDYLTCSSLAGVNAPSAIFRGRIHIHKSIDSGAPTGQLRP